jgi:hypothetical protein
MRPILTDHAIEYVRGLTLVQWACSETPLVRESRRPQQKGVGMADRMLLLTWNEPARGLEARALEVFNEALGILGRKQQDGAIESFDVALLGPNSYLSGFMSIKGSAEQITALRSDEEFMRNTVDASLCVDGIQHLEGYCNEGVATQMAMYQEAIGKVPQRA